MKNVILNLIILATLNASALAQVILPTHINGSFSVAEWLYNSPLESRANNPDFPNGVHASFSFAVDVPQQGAFESVVALDSWTPDPFTIGTTNLTRNDVGASAAFQDGVFQYLFIGGLLDGVNTVSSHGFDGSLSDFMFIYTPNPDALYFIYQVDGEFAQAQGENIQARIDISQGQPVPEASSVGIIGALFLLGLVVMSRIAGLQATRHKFCIVTNDLDFGTLLARQRTTKPSVIQLRVSDTNPQAAGRALLDAINLHREEIEQGAIITILPSKTKATLLPFRA